MWCCSSSRPASRLCPRPSGCSLGSARTHTHTHTHTHTGESHEVGDISFSTDQRHPLQMVSLFNVVLVLRALPRAMPVGALNLLSAHTVDTHRDTR